jgi:hypothetical protein
MKMPKSIVLLVAWLVASTRIGAQIPPPATPTVARPAAAANLYRYRFLGVYDDLTGDPIEGVEVADIVNGNKSLTTKTGTVSLFFLPDGGALVRLRKIGYETQTIPIAITPADTTPVTIIMTHATQLPAVVVRDSAPKGQSVGLRRFEEHRALGFGRFIDETEFRKHDNSTMANLLTSRLPGLTSVVGPGGAKYIVSAHKPCSGPALRTCRQSDCYVTVYIDNAKTFDASTSAGALKPDFEHMSVNEYAAAEFYQGAETPAEYNATSSGCGVLLLWTRIR